MQVKTGLRESVYITFLGGAALKSRSWDLQHHPLNYRDTDKAMSLTLSYPTLISHITWPKEADSGNSMSLESRNFPISSILSTLHKKEWPFSYSSRHVFLSGSLCVRDHGSSKIQQSFLFSAYWSTRNRKRWIKNKLCIRPACVNWFPVYEIYSKVN